MIEEYETVERVRSRIFIKFENGIINKNIASAQPISIGKTIMQTFRRISTAVFGRFFCHNRSMLRIQEIDFREYGRKKSGQ